MLKRLKAAMDQAIAAEDASEGLNSEPTSESAVCSGWRQTSRCRRPYERVRIGTQNRRALGPQQLHVVHEGGFESLYLQRSYEELWVKSHRSIF
jgi:hypothetical protein